MLLQNQQTGQFLVPKNTGLKTPNYFLLGDVKPLHFRVGVKVVRKERGHSRRGEERGRRRGDPTPVGLVQEKEAVQQDGHVTISWYYSGHPSVRAEARAGSNLDGSSNG